MCDLVLFFHQIEFLLDRWVVLVPVLAHLEQYFNHVLHALVDIGFVKDISELIENGIRDLRVHFLQVLSNFSGQADGDFHAIVGGLVKQQQQDLRNKHLVGDLIVDKVRNEGRGRDADSFVISLECLAELNHQPRDKKLSNLRQLCVHNGGHRRVDGGKWQTGGLRLHDRSAEQPTAANQILTKKLRHDILDIGDIDLVDQTVDRLLQRLPCHTLVLLAGLIRDLRLQRAKPCRGNVSTTRAHVQQLLILGLGRCLFLLLGHGLASGFLLLVLTNTLSELAFALDCASLVHARHFGIVSVGITRGRTSAVRGGRSRRRRALSSTGGR
jgi:hypothetical protein